MSLFLGPIHSWLWGKICAQEELTQALCTSFGLDSSTLDELGRIESAPLAEQIDGSNIHGWLQAHIKIAESRYARATKLLVESGKSIDELASKAEEIGRSQAEAKGISELDDGQAAYKVLDTYTLNGMPCDGVLEVSELGEDHVVFTMTQEIHEQNIAPDLDTQSYYRLRLAWIAGILSAYGWEAEEIEPYTYLLRRA